MNVCLIGYGKMGRLIQPLAEGRGHSVLTVDPSAADADRASLSEVDLSTIDVAIDFTAPDAVAENLRTLCKHRTNVVVGSTGWPSGDADLMDRVRESGIGFLYATNFSIGVQLFLRIARRASELFDKFKEYDVAAIEHHHREKKDSPSGTALSLAEALMEPSSRKTRLVTDRLDRPPAPEELHLASLRSGSIPGTHEALFDSPADTISVKHTARNREGFAIGAVRVAEWLADKQGIKTIDDYLDDLF